MVIGHDFDRFPELTNGQMAIYYFESPHKQILEDFDCEVIKVHDGDTITVNWRERDFAFPIRFANIAAPELDEKGGTNSQDWMEQRLLGKEIMVGINYNNRVGKFGRILGTIMQGGLDVGLESVLQGHAQDFDSAAEAEIPDIASTIALV